MRSVKPKQRWLVGALIALTLGTVTGMAAARALVRQTEIPIPSHGAEISLPALDAMVARLAAEARAGSTY